MSMIRSAVRKFHNDTAGAMSVEKIMILGLIALPILIILVLFRNTIAGWFQTQSTQLQNQPAAPGSP